MRTSWVVVAWIAAPTVVLAGTGTDDGAVRAGGEAHTNRAVQADGTTRAGSDGGPDGGRAPTETPAAPGAAAPAAAAADPRGAAAVELGRRLFFEPAVSRGGRVACAACHDPTHGFTDRAHPSTDEWGQTRRRTMPLADLGPGPFHSDGEFPTVRSLLDARIAPLDLLRATDAGRVRKVASGVSETFPKSYGTSSGDPPGLESVADRLAATGLYAAAFTAAFGDARPTHDRVCDAIEAFVGTLRTADGPIDRFLAGDDTALPTSAALGFGVFTGKAGCAQCHDVRPDGPAARDGRAALRDGQFHDTGVSARSEFAAARDERRKPDLERADAGLGGQSTDAAERRRGAMKFKTPSLRDVARRGPFMHDGSLATLADVVAFYDGGGTPHPGLDPRVKKLSLSDAEKDRLVAFLLALSGDEPPGLTDAPPGRRAMRVRLVDPSGAPLARRPVAVVPEGGAFRSERAANGLAVLTDAAGWVAFDFPTTTHVRLRPEGAAVAELVPDCADEPTLVAVPDDRVALRIRAERGSLPRGIRAVAVPKQDGAGRVAEAADRDDLEFVFVRALADDVGLYLAPAPAGGRAASRRFLVPDGKGGGALTTAIDADLRPGATSAADLTPLRHRESAR